MKKTLLLLSSALVLAACGSNSATSSSTASSAASSAASTTVAASSAASSTTATEGALVDGTYKLVTDADERGWHTEFTITVEGGKITASDYDNYNAEGGRKSEDAEYEANMKAKSGVGPSEYVKQLNEALVSSQDPEAVDVVTGATNSSDAFKAYAAQLIEAAKKGDTTEIKAEVL